VGVQGVNNVLDNSNIKELIDITNNQELQDKYLKANGYKYENKTIVKDIPEYTVEELISQLGHEFKIKK
jgi:DNA integrity scanning protein DisA with diadenylate cyclase activity